MTRKEFTCTPKSWNKLSKIIGKQEMSICKGKHRAKHWGLQWTKEQVQNSLQVIFGRHRANLSIATTTRKGVQGVPGNIRETGAV